MNDNRRSVFLACLVVFFALAESVVIDLEEAPNGHFLKSGRAFDETAALRKKANLTDSVAIYVYGYAFPFLHGLNAYVFKYKDSAKITVDSRIIENFSDAELEAVLAHEIGHLRGAVLDTAESRRFNESVFLLSSQTEADRFALDVVGEKNLEASLKRLGLTDLEVAIRLRQAASLKDN